MAEHVGPEFLRRFQQALADPMRLQMVPHEFIGVEFRGIRRQEKQLQAAVRRRHELLDHLHPVRRMPIDDEEDRPRLIVQQALQERDEPRRRAGAARRGAPG